MSQLDVELKLEVRRLLETLPVCKPSSSYTQFYVRCPFCGDSKDPSHGHLSIVLDTTSDKPMMYRCLKCPESGLVTADLLERLGVGYQSSLKDDLIQYNRKTVRKSKFFSDRPKTYQIPVFSGSLSHLKKLDYLSNRLGVPIGLQDCSRLNIILDLFEFMKLNRISTIPNANMKWLDILNDRYVGFLSSNRNRIIWRLTGTSDRLSRYHKMILDPTNVHPNTFYVIPTEWDLLYTDPFHIHIAEGTFDILSVFFNLQNQNQSNCLYAAACGFGMDALIRKLILSGLTTDIDLHLYSDNDKTDHDHEQYLNSMRNRIWIDHATIHRNRFSGEKDYGVPLSNLLDTTKILR